ncbi:substrate-binding periplasmic protein [Rhodoplanes roseus]|uniref:Solute-binding protein family 3/N-terminal domain-containing protein n=1 Tax=Rhodoplanes roseus TaxID=29409 RepID=A0A327KYD7_9BRAD|nr:transporter substrate-binding domain-containing protein [Rhodoplanes roseus]RAI43291.1 hypothetical protein CH341_15055 [Rhodoplanes roseus]
MRLISVLLALLMVVAGGSLARAQDRAPASDLGGILSRGVLRVALPAFDSPPFFETRDGDVAGFDIDIARRIAAELGVDVEFLRGAASFNEVVDVVARGEADIAVCKLSRTLPRARRVIFTRPYVLLKHALVLNRIRFAEIAQGRDAPVVLRDYRGSLAVIADSAFAEFARRNFPKAEIQAFPDWDSVLAAVRSGRVAAAYRDELEIKRMLVEHASASLMLRTVTLGDLTDSISMAVPASSPHFAAWLDLFIADRIGTSTVDAVLGRSERAAH